MTSTLRRFRHLLAPAAGAVYLVLWIVAEAGRSGLADHVLVVSALAVAIGLANWMPSTALGLVVVVPLLQAFRLLHRPTDTTWPEYLAIAIVVGIVGAGRSDLLRWLAVPVLAVASVAAAWAMVVPTVADPDVWGLWVGSSTGTRTNLAFIALAIAGASGIGWAIGVAIGATWRIGLARVRVVEAERETEVTTGELHAEQERARIARDVHDSLAHSLAVVVSQAQGAAAIAVRDEHAARALQDIADVSRSALGDVRALVERIQGAGDDARHGLEDVPPLVEDMRELGMTASFEQHGAPSAVAPAVGSAVHRIVQESLTNVLKHQGRTATARVVLDWRGPGLGVVVTSTGGAPLVELDGAGSGIAGMQERARLAGGWLRAGTGDAEHEWVVTAWLPTVDAPAVAPMLEVAR
ncbi:signal transduction histidine kinase [Curtobacterium sp. PhB130]|uniref:sensor histidine kinase n=1 Tax=Curtobacterium sp. PhB130 TaxID=2485178 RepID=UPI000F4C8161|nr:histidine kinase [Curtobacterium sp. PhB130]ROS75055.1 signal transduction histidine kinase [Curtobacterium sp. PhB130]